MYRKDELGWPTPALAFLSTNVLFPLAPVVTSDSKPSTSPAAHPHPLTAMCTFSTFTCRFSTILRTSRNVKLVPSP